MESWNDCVKVYDPDKEAAEYPKDIGSKEYGAYLKYVSKLGKTAKNTIWYDKNADLCFGADQDFFANPADFSFFHQKENFLTHEPWGQYHLQNVLGQHLGQDVKLTNEIMFQEHPEFSKYENKTVLLVGAGPSAADIDWEKMDLDYDYVWSCNNFYKNEKLKDVSVDLALLGPDVDLKDSELLMKLKRDETFCLFEGGVSPFRSQSDLLGFKNQLPEKVSYFHLRYFSKIGTMPRMLCLASLLNVEKVYFVGIDGFPGQTGDKYKHAFEGKEKSHDGRVFSYNLHRRQYVLLWEYLLSLDTQANYQNLGEGHEANLTTDISQKLFPLNLGENNE